ncbi:MAG TPA: S41 family peptidase [Verrucomicrobiales bacterium]|nr:S41 family peptidase [Verrucomicrobiales bacterium]
MIPPYHRILRPRSPRRWKARLGAKLGALLLLAFPPAGPGLAEEARGEDWDSLDQNQLQQAFRLLSERYLDRERLDPLTWNRAAFAGLPHVLPDGAVQLVPPPSAATDVPSIAFASGVFGANRAYVRIAGAPESCLEALDSALASAKASGCQELILDLRCPESSVPGAFPFAAEVIDRFVPAGRVLFELRVLDPSAVPRVYSSRSSAAWNGGLIALCDSETSPAGEVIASVLRQQANALLVGEPTPGRMLEYEDHPLSATAVLRFAVAAVVFPGGTSGLGLRVEPPLRAVARSELKRELYQAVDSGTRSLEDCVAERPRPRMNEAALVAGVNPELPYLLHRARGHEHPADSPPRIDRALQFAADALIVRRQMDLMRGNPPSGDATSKEENK